MSPHEQYILDQMLVEARVMMMEGSPLELDQSQFSDCVTSLIGRLREAEMDAARYRWLRDRVCMFYVSAECCDSKDAYLTVTGYGDDDSREVVDAAIDDQMKEKVDE